MIFNFIIEDPEKSLFTEKLSQTLSVITIMHYFFSSFLASNNRKLPSVLPT